MKDITKGQILGILDDLAKELVRDRRQYAQQIHAGLKDAFLYSQPGIAWESSDGRLDIKLTIRRTDAYAHRLMKERKHE